MYNQVTVREPKFNTVEKMTYKRTGKLFFLNDCLYHSNLVKIWFDGIIDF